MATLPDKVLLSMLKKCFGDEAGREGRLGRRLVHA